MKAILQGEFHTSTKDREALEEHITSDVDALFVEGRADRVSPERWTLPYILFLTGAFQIFWIETLFGEDGLEVSIPRHDEIDITLPYLYEDTPRRVRQYSIIFPMIIGALALFGPEFPVPLVVVPPFVDTAYSMVIDLMMIFGTPLLFSFFLIVYEERYAGSRDDMMAASIIEISEEQGYQTVVVSCGQAHLTELSSRLEAHGWQTDPHDSTHESAAKFWERLT